MTARTLTSSVPSVSGTAKTAEVFEFSCLYTHDLVRKQKRWHDGRLKFHTFNRLVSVTDRTGNKIGSAHFRAGEDVEEGLEINLDNGTPIQVGEPTGKSQSDISALFERKPKEIIAEPRARLGEAVSVARNPGPRLQSQMKNAPLSAILTPRGPHGRAMLPARSPYEQRNRERDNDWASERAAKRQRVEHVARARDAAMASPLPRTKAVPGPMWARTATTYRPGSASPRQSNQIPNSNPPVAPRAISKEFVVITSDTEDIESDLTIPATPPGFPGLAVSAGNSFTTPGHPAPPRSPPVSTKNKVADIQQETELEEMVADAEKDIEEEPLPRTKALKLSSGSKRKMLLCEDAPSLAVNGKAAARRNKSIITQDPVLPSAKASRNPSDIRKLPNGFTQVSSSPSETSATSNRRVASDGYTRLDPVVNCGKSISNAASAHNPKVFAELDKMALDYGHMDQQIMRKVSAKSKVVTSITKPQQQRQQEQQQEQRRPPKPGDASTRDSRLVQSENDVPEDSIPIDVPVNSTSKPLFKANPTRATLEKKFERALQRTSSLTLNKVGGENKARTNESRPPSPLKDTDVGPWSTEVMDLFDWRPPGFVYLGERKGFGIPESEAIDST